jgi:IMP dehydrogenase
MPDPQSQSGSASKKLEEVVIEKSGPLSPDDSVETAGDRMRSLEANSWPVAEGRKLVGVIDHPDPDHKAGGHGHDPRTTRVGDTMSRNFLYCYEDQEAEEAQRIMVEQKLNHLPVVDRELRIVGIISRRDLDEANCSKESS